MEPKVRYWEREGERVRVGKAKEREKKKTDSKEVVQMVDS